MRSRGVDQPLNLSRHVQHVPSISAPPLRIYPAEVFAEELIARTRDRLSRLVDKVQVRILSSRAALVPGRAPSKRKREIVCAQLYALPP